MTGCELENIKKFSKVSINSKMISEGDCFVAIKGERSDGHDFVRDCLDKGAAYCVVQTNIWKVKKGITSDDRIIEVPDTHYALSFLSARAFGEPAKSLKVIGITGTNGKTTTAFLIDKMISLLGYGIGMIGTVIYKIGDEVVEADRTTPDAVRLNELLAKMVEKKLPYAVMEVSSHALDQYRAGHVHYDQAIFTNLTPEHLDYHKTMEEYFNAKARIFDNLKDSGTAIINIDDEWAPKLISRVEKNRVLTYGMAENAMFHPTGLKLSIDGTNFDVLLPEGKLKIKTKLIGLHNVSNILAALCVGYVNGFDFRSIEKCVANFNEPPGRLESVNTNKDFKIFVDYAHTKDALAKAITALRPYVKGDLMTVFGCGGDRDRTKRPEMGKAATELSDIVVITSDNPRSEKPELIISEIEKGIAPRNKHKYKVIADRREAIKYAVSTGKKGDIILIAGKGHEAYQIIGDKQIQFDDRLVAKEFLNNVHD